MKNNHKNILVIVVGFIFIGMIIKLNWPLYIAFGVGALSILSNRVTSFILKIWFGIAKVLGYINSRILLTIIYYLILLPSALISRMFGKRSLDLKKNDQSYFTLRNHQYVKSDLEKPW